MGGSLEGNGQEVLEVAKPPGLEAVVEDGIWKVKPRGRLIGDFVQVISKKMSQQQGGQMKRVNFCGSFGCGVADCRELRHAHARGGPVVQEQGRHQDRWEEWLGEGREPD